MKLQIILTFLLLLSCSNESSGEEDLSSTGFYHSPEKIISSFINKKLDYRENFLMATALKKNKRYLKSVYYYTNSCFKNDVLKKQLKSFKNSVPDILKKTGGRTEFFNDAAYEIANIYFKYRRYLDTTEILKLVETDKSGLQLESILLEAEAYKKMGLHDRGISVLKKGLTAYSDINAVSYIMIRIASIYEQQENWKDAYNEYLQVIELKSSNWQSKAASSRISRILRGKNIRLSDKREVFLTAKALYINREYNSSVALIDKNINYNKSTDFILLNVKNLCRGGSNKRLNIFIESYKQNTKLYLVLKKTAADEYWKMGKRNAPLKLYSEIASSGVEPYTRMALKKIARYYSKNDKTLGSSLIKAFYEKYPDDYLSGNLLWLKGKFYLKKKNFKKTAEFLEESLRISPRGTFSGNCRFWLYKIYVDEKKIAKAENILRELVLYNSNSSYTSILLNKILIDKPVKSILKLYSQADDSKTNEKLFLHSLLFVKEADIKKRDRRIKELSHSIQKNYSDFYNSILNMKINSHNEKRFKNLEKYFKTGYIDGIKREVYRLNNENVKSEDIYITLSHFGLKYNNYYYSAYYSLLALKSKKLYVDLFFMPVELLKILYPNPFEKCISRFSNKYKLDTNFINSIIRAESMYRHNAISKSGAVGLMQILPSTARGIARKLKKRDYRLDNPCTSIEFGCYYINWLKKSQGSSTTRILAAYNAGLGRVKNWKRWMNKNMDPDLIIEIIPFDETRNYVLRINKFMEHYRLIYN